MFVRNTMRKLKLFILAMATLFLSSCLEILEDVKINQDGSGVYKLNVNLSQSKSQIDKILAQDSIGGHPIPQKSSILKEFNQLIELIKTQQGISEVVPELDLTNYILKLSFSFDKIESLNIAINSIIKAKDPKAPLNPVVYSFSDKTFSRSFNSELINQIQRDKEKVNAFLTNFDQAKFTSIIRFDDLILKSSHTDAKISSNLKNCFEQVYINNLLSNNKFHHHNISLQ